MSVTTRPQDGGVEARQDVLLADLIVESVGGDWGKADEDGLVPTRVARGTDFDRLRRQSFEELPVRYVSAASRNKRQLSAGCLLVELSGGSKDQATGRIVLITDDISRRLDHPLTFSNFVRLLRVDEDRVAADYFAYAWQQLYRVGRTRVYEKRTTGIRNFKLADFLAHERILVPPLAQQRTAVDVLYSVEHAREMTRRVIHTLRTARASVLQHQFRFGPVPVRDVEDVSLQETAIGRIPAHWSVVRLSDLGQLVSGGTPSKKNSQWWAGSIPWASPKDIKVPRLSDTEDHLTKEGVEAGSRMVPKGSLLVVIRGMILARDVPVAMTDVPMALNQDLKAILPNDEVLPEYLLYALEYGKGRLAREIGTSAHGTRRIGTKSLGDLPIPVPPRREQQGIVDSLGAIDQKLERERNRGIALTRLGESLAQNLFGGSNKPNLAHRG